jgi:hypothetical protein
MCHVEALVKDLIRNQLVLKASQGFGELSVLLAFLSKCVAQSRECCVSFFQLFLQLVNLVLEEHFVGFQTVHLQDGLTGLLLSVGCLLLALSLLRDQLTDAYLKGAEFVFCAVDLLISE